MKLASAVPKGAAHPYFTRPKFAIAEKHVFENCVTLASIFNSCGDCTPFFLGTGVPGN
jgi:hypothetical protein